MLTRATLAFLLAAFTAVVACRGRGHDEPTPTPQDISDYFEEMTATLTQAYAHSEGLVRIFDDSSYTDALSVNARRFEQGSQDLRAISPPPQFDDEHETYAEAFREIADELERSLKRIHEGEDATDVMLSQIDGSLADAFAQQSGACHGILQKAEEFGVYEGLECGGDPYFIEGAQPDWAERVFVNRCCGGSHPLSNPLDIFYGSDEPWETTREHYEDEMTKRGFELINGNDSRLLFAKVGRPQECFSIKEFDRTDVPLAVEESDLARLDKYDYAYVSGYTQICGG